MSILKHLQSHCHIDLCTWVTHDQSAGLSHTHVVAGLGYPGETTSQGTIPTHVQLLLQHISSIIYIIYIRKWHKVMHTCGGWFGMVWCIETALHGTDHDRPSLSGQHTQHTHMYRGHKTTLLYNSSHKNYKHETQHIQSKINITQSLGSPTPSEYWFPCVAILVSS